MALRYVNADPSLSLTELRLLIEQEEEMRGPLRDIGYSADTTVLAFDLTADYPSHPPAIQLAVEGQPKPEHIVSEGRAFVEGRLRDVVIYRPTRSASLSAA